MAALAFPGTGAPTISGANRVLLEVATFSRAHLLPLPNPGYGSKLCLTLILGDCHEVYEAPGMALMLDLILVFIFLNLSRTPSRSYPPGILLIRLVAPLESY
jgi:hypothetical protein